MLGNIVENKKLKKFTLRGIFPELTTPFNEKHEVNYEKLRDNLLEFEKLPFTGYLLGGPYGEISSLTVEERITMVKRARQYIGSDKILIVNVYSESTKHSCELAQQVASCGADSVLVMPPFFFRKHLNREAYLAHYRLVADISPIPVILYNKEDITGITLLLSDILKLAEHPNIKGIVEDDVGRIGDISEGVKQDKLDFEIAKSSALSFEGALLAGAVGGITPMANIVGEQLCKIYELTLKNKISSAVDIQLKLDQTDRLLGLRYLGVAGLKAAMDLVGVYGGSCRLPIQPLPPQELKRIRDKMVEDGIL